MNERKMSRLGLVVEPDMRSRYCAPRIRKGGGGAARLFGDVAIVGGYVGDLIEDICMRPGGCGDVGEVTPGG